MEERIIYGIFKRLHLCCFYYRGFELIGLIQLLGLSDFPCIQFNQSLHILYTVYVYDNLRLSG